MLMSKTKLENSLMNLKQEMKMQRCQQCGQSLSVCQCQSMSVVCEEPYVFNFYSADIKQLFLRYIPY